MSSVPEGHREDIGLDNATTSPARSVLSERRRVREVRKYHVRSPNERLDFAGGVAANISGIGTTTISSPNTTLTALMQLIAWRLDMQRAMVSVVDEDAQYFIAEATKTLNLHDGIQHGDGDALWMGCGSTSRSEALCANTIEQQAGLDNYASFSVNDLSKDDRFCRLPYVANPPNFRYYAGTPLITRSGVPIGSVFVIDDRPRGPPTEAEIEFLGVMARNVMEYLEMRRENEMKIRVDTM
jgi:GAF domain-containing protein